MRPRYLVDESALARMPLQPVSDRLAPILEAGEAATCSMVELEVLYSTRNHHEHQSVGQRRALGYSNGIAEVSGQPAEWVVPRGSL